MTCSLRRDHRRNIPPTETPDWQRISMLFHDEPAAIKGPRAFDEPVSRFERQAERDTMARFSTSERDRLLMPLWRRVRIRLVLTGLALFVVAVWVFAAFMEAR